MQKRTTNIKDKCFTLKSNFQKSLDLDLKNLGLLYWARLNYVLDLDIEWTTLLDSDQFYDILELDLKSTQATSLDLDRIYYMLGLDLKNTWTNLLDSDWFYYNQAEMLLEKSENLLEISVKQLVIQSSLASSISLSHTKFGVWKTIGYARCKVAQNH